MVLLIWYCHSCLWKYRDHGGTRAGFRVALEESGTVYGHTTDVSLRGSLCLSLSSLLLSKQCRKELEGDPSGRRPEGYLEEGQGTAVWVL